MDSEHENELARAKGLLISALLFLFTGCISWGELVYLVSGQDAEAEVTKAYEVTSRGRFGISQGRRLTLEYTFTEPDGTRRTGTATVPTDWTPPAGGKVPVRYTAGADGSVRLSGRVQWWAVGLFTASLGSVVVFGYRLWREAVEATRESKPRRRKS